MINKLNKLNTKPKSNSVVLIQQDDMLVKLICSFYKPGLGEMHTYIRLFRRLSRPEMFEMSALSAKQCSLNTTTLGDFNF